jgi:hypothetical protein
MRALKDGGFDPTALVQTIRGTKQALRCAASTVHDLANNGDLERAGPGRITTDSILKLIQRRIEASRQKQKEVA